MADQKAIEAFHSSGTNTVNISPSRSEDQTTPAFRNLINYWYYLERNTQAKIANIFKSGIAKDEALRSIWEGILGSYKLSEYEKKLHTPKSDVDKVDLAYVERTIVDLFPGLWAGSSLDFRVNIVRFFVGVVQCYSGHYQNLFSDIIPTMDTKDYQTALRVVASLRDIPEARDAVLASLRKKKLLADAAPGSDISAWKPAEHYADRKRLPDLGRKENVVEFLERVWSPIIASGELPMLRLRQEDPQALTALNNWKREHGWPESLPVVSRNQKAAARIEQEASLPSDLRSTRTEWALEGRRRRQSHPSP